MLWNPPLEAKRWLWQQTVHGTSAPSLDQALNYPDKDMYKSAVVDYAMNNAQSTSWYYVNGTEEFNATLDSVFSSVWAGEETMEEAINENLEELQDIFAENNG